MKLAVQVKLRKDTKCTITSSEINRLIKFAESIGAAPIVAVVTHDLETAFVVGNKIAVMNEAKILQFGTADEIYKFPTTQWVAEFVGEANFFKGQATGTEIETVLGKLPLAKPSSGALNVLVRPEHISLANGKDWKIEKIEFYGHDTRYLISKENHALVSVRTPMMGTQRTGDFVDLKYTGPPTQTY